MIIRVDLNEVYFYNHKSKIVKEINAIIKALGDNLTIEVCIQGFPKQEYHTTFDYWKTQGVVFNNEVASELQKDIAEKIFELKHQVIDAAPLVQTIIFNKDTDTFRFYVFSGNIKLWKEEIFHKIIGVFDKCLSSQNLKVTWAEMISPD